MKLRLLFVLFLTQVFVLSAAQRDWNPGEFELLQLTERKPARTAVLIMTPPDSSIHTDGRFSRWQLGKKVWELYMNVHPHVDCYFLQNTDLRKGASEQTWIEGNTIYVGDDSYEGRILLSKTTAALEKLLPNYTHFFRTNANAFVNLNTLNEYAETHHQSMFTGPLWQGSWYLFGYGVLFSADVAAHIVNEYRRLEGNYIVSHHVPEDLALNSLATGVFAYYDHIGHVEGDPEFACCPTLPLGVRQLMCESSFSTLRFSQYGLQLFPAPSFEQTIDYCSQALNSVMLYRIRNGFDLDKLAEVYEYLLNNIYPELPKFDLVEYAKSLPPVYYDDN